MSVQAPCKQTMFRKITYQPALCTDDKQPEQTKVQHIEISTYFIIGMHASMHCFSHPAPQHGKPPLPPPHGNMKNTQERRQHPSIHLLKGRRYKHLSPITSPFGISGSSPLPQKCYNHWAEPTRAGNLTMAIRVIR